ncbi:MAG: HEPN domain-containing protein [Firmicutes bacterium]|nr:HEPN domain-containing protein [Bacillota bacterium]
MDKEYYDTLAMVRMNRAKELLDEAIELLEKGSYKSANNRAFYSMKKSIKALLAMEQIEVTTHNGGLKQFNYVFIYNGDGTFDSQDYQRIAGAEQIRNASDYDDFYIASKDETRQLVENAAYILKKIDKYIIDRLQVVSTFQMQNTEVEERAEEDIE